MLQSNAGVYPIFPLLQSANRVSSFDQNSFCPHLEDAVMKPEEISRLFSHWSRVGECPAIPARPQVPASRFSS